MTQFLLIIFLFRIKLHYCAKQTLVDHNIIHQSPIPVVKYRYFVVQHGDKFKLLGSCSNVRATSPMSTQVIEGGSDPVGSEFFYRIQHSFCRIPFDRNPVRISSDFDGTRWNPGRIWSGFIALRWIPMKSGPDSDWKESDENRVESDRFFMKDVGFRWNPTRIRSKTIESIGRITWPGKLKLSIRS
jgi:hypothetical protein